MNADLERSACVRCTCAGDALRSGDARVRVPDPAPSVRSQGWPSGPDKGVHDVRVSVCVVVVVVFALRRHVGLTIHSYSFNAHTCPL